MPSSEEMLKQDLQPKLSAKPGLTIRERYDFIMRAMHDGNLRKSETTDPCSEMPDALQTREESSENVIETHRLHYIGCCPKYKGSKRMCIGQINPAGALILPIFS